MVEYEYDCAADLLDRHVEFAGIGLDIRLSCRVIGVLASVQGDCFAGAVEVLVDGFGPDPAPHEVLRLDLSRYVAEHIRA